MKTLIITGTAKSIISSNKIEYDLTLFGQTKEHPLTVYITSRKFTCKCYDEMQAICRGIYSEYFKTDLFNIISLDSVIII